MIGPIRKLAGETVLYGLSHVGPRLLQFFFLAPYLTRKIGTEEYGIHGTMYAYAAFFIVLFTFRMETAFFRYASRSDSSNKVFSTALICILPITIIGCAIMFFYDHSLASLLATPGDERYIHWFLGIIALDAVSALPFARLRLENKPKKFALLKLLNVLTTLVIAFALLEGLPFLGSFDINWALDLYNPAHKLDYVFLANLIASALIMVFLFSEFSFSPKDVDKALISKMYHYSWPLVIVSLTGVINLLFDRIFIKELVPGGEAYALSQSGIYNACVKIAVPMSLFATAFNYAAEPFFFKNSQNADARVVYARVALAFTITGSILFLLTTLFLDQLQYLIGEEFREGISIVPIVMMAYLFLGLYYTFSIWYKLTDQTIYGTYISISGAIISIVLNILLIPVIGYMGSAISVLVCFLFMCVAAWYLGQKHYPIPFNLKKIISYALVSFTIYWVSSLLYSYWDLSIMLKVITNTAILISFLYFVMRVERISSWHIKSIFRKNT